MIVSAVAAGGLAGAPAAGARRARNDLSPRRERTYSALVGSVAVAQGARANPDYLERVSTDFRAWYRSAMPHVRASVNATLDALDERANGRFPQMSRARRANLLRTMSARATAAQAIALASPPFASYDDDGIRCSPGVV
jgi:hypothetical protein